MRCVYIAVFCLLAFVQTAVSLRCWSCSSSSERHCGDPFNKTFFHLNDCDNNRSPHTYSQPTTTAACKKSKQIINGQETVIRQCVWDKETACIPSSVHTSTKDVFCEACTEDGCNSAHRFTSATFMAVLPAFLWALAAKIL